MVGRPSLPELAQIVEEIRAGLAAKNQIRDLTLGRSRELIRLCSLSIRAIHRHEWVEAGLILQAAREAAAAMVAGVSDHGDLYEAGYTQDALKELAEAHLLSAFVGGVEMAGPDDLSIPPAAYLNGMGEAASELRRYVLDLIRQGKTAEAEPYLAVMDDVYTHLVAIDFPDALTGGLRRTTDMLRGVLERTRGDLTVAVKQEDLQAALSAFENRIASVPLA
jgi:translin